MREPETLFDKAYEALQELGQGIASGHAMLEGVLRHAPAEAIDPGVRDELECVLSHLARVNRYANCGEDFARNEPQELFVTVLDPHPKFRCTPSGALPATLPVTSCCKPRAE